MQSEQSFKKKWVCLVVVQPLSSVLTSVTNFGRKKNEFAGHELNDTLNCAQEGGLPHVLAWAIDAAEIGKPKASGMPWTAL
jgi:hypothetical protein